MLFSRNLLCAGIILISHGAYAMQSTIASETRTCPACRGDPDCFNPSKCPRCGGIGTVVSILEVEEKVHTFTEQPFNIGIYDENPCDGLDCPFRRKNHQRPFLPQPGAEDKCDRCKGRGKVKGSKVIVHTVKNEECLDQGIIPGSQLLSVNGTRVNTLWEALRLITEGKAKLPVKMTFLCLEGSDTSIYTKRGREKDRLLKKQLEAQWAQQYCKKCCKKRINDAAKCPRCPSDRDTQWVPLHKVNGF